ncbi:MAG: cysteine desulfurase-like protein [Candidatus Latescibacterota bacterium]
MSMDIEYVRSQFPALSGEWVFFDNAGGTQIVKPVVDRIEDYLYSCNVQLGATYEVSRAAGDRVAAGAKAMAKFVNAADPSEIIMGSSTTLLMRLLSLCLGGTLMPRDEVIVTNLDHEANIGPWADLAKKGVTVKIWRLNPDTWDLQLEDLKELMTPRTRLVAVTHTSNILGKINPIRDIARFVHERRAMIVVDGVAYAPHRCIDMQDLGVDFYALSFYKIYGPHYAMLYGKRGHLQRLPGINHFFIGQSEIPNKFQPGSVNYELSSGMLGLWDYLDGFAQAHGWLDVAEHSHAQVDFIYDIIAKHEEALAEKLLSYLTSKSTVRIIGVPEPDRAVRVPTISFVVNRTDSDSITLEVDKHKIGIRYGDFYARRLINDLGLGPQKGVVRVSMVHYNTLEEVDRLIEVLEGIL